MRNRILAGLGVAALATAGIAVPANALSSTTADLWSCTHSPAPPSTSSSRAQPT